MLWNIDLKLGQNYDMISQLQLRQQNFNTYLSLKGIDEARRSFSSSLKDILLLFSLNFSHPVVILEKGGLPMVLLGFSAIFGLFSFFNFFRLDPDAVSLEGVPWELFLPAGGTDPLMFMLIALLFCC